MKKLIVICSTLLFAFGVYAGAVTWGLDTSVSAPTGVTGYLVNVNTCTDVTAITTYLSKNGVDVAALKAAAWQSASADSLNSDYIQYKDAGTNATPSSTYNLAIFFLDADEGKVIVSNEILAVSPVWTTDDAGYSPDKDSIMEDPALFTLNEDMTSWYATSVQLPEPTVLALLALGVAGLALKRKVA